MLDAAVLVPATLRDTSLRAAQADLYRVRWTREILGEVERTLIDNELTTSDRARRLIEIMNRAFPFAIVDDYEHLIPHLTNDPKDRHVLAAAIQSGADLIVTQNLRHFRDVHLTSYGVRAISADEFLHSYLDRVPEIMLDIVARQAADLRNPPMTATNVLKSLSMHAPQFARSAT
ncbi:MAG: PIN domain-containing protein, partial [Chloroflexota bacterium]